MLRWLAFSVNDAFEVAGDDCDGSWSVDVDESTGIAFTWYGHYPSPDEIDHVQKFHRGDYCSESISDCECNIRMRQTW